MDELTRTLLAAAAGDRRAVASFVRSTQADVWRFCAHLVDPQAADDLTQEVYVRALTSIPRFRGDASAKTWLFAVARRVAADEIRARQRQRRIADPDAEPTSTGAVIHDPAGELELHALVAELDEDRRSAFVLTQLLGWTYAEAAEACEVPVGTIRSRVARARAQLIGSMDAADLPTTPPGTTAPGITTRNATDRTADGAGS
jgi:RNA polymerase sigma-70 factor, ECF subfamily